MLIMFQGVRKRTKDRHTTSSPDTDNPLDKEGRKSPSTASTCSTGSDNKTVSLIPGFLREIGDIWLTYVCIIAPPPPL